MSEIPRHHDHFKPGQEKNHTDEVKRAIASLQSQGIKNWEILDAWSEFAHQQGDYAVADTLESAAFELGKPIE
ncbi:MAG TPA: hypothetical protein V6D33_17565 [Cyanophyceae cyanobacterium]